MSTEEWTDDTQVSLVVRCDGEEKDDILIELREVKEFVALIRPVISQMVALKADGRTEEAERKGNELKAVMDNWIDSKRSLMDSNPH